MTKEAGEQVNEGQVSEEPSLRSRDVREQYLKWTNSGVSEGQGRTYSGETWSSREGGMCYSTRAGAVCYCWQESGATGNVHRVAACCCWQGVNFTFVQHSQAGSPLRGWRRLCEG